MKAENQGRVEKVESLGKAEKLVKVEKAESLGKVEKVAKVENQEKAENQGNLERARSLREIQFQEIPAMLKKVQPNGTLFFLPINSYIPN